MIMKLNKNSNTFLAILTCIFLLYLASQISKRNPTPFFFVSKQERAINVKSFIFENFNLGYRRLISSIFWISTIIESDHDHYKKRDLNSWMYIRFSTLMKLEPEFLPTYTFGGPYLSIIKDDLVGAGIIYDFGLKQYPNEFELLKNAGFHYYFEVGDFNKAKLIYQKLKQFKKLPITISTTISRIEANAGNLEDALTVLTELEKKYPSESSFVKKIQSYRNSIRTEIDLECLNSSKDIAKCNSENLFGNPYVKIDGKYQSSVLWSPFRIKVRKTLK